MLFIRLAGCNVGQYLGRGTSLADEIQKGLYILPADEALLKSQTNSICTAADGQKFLCDTDYHRSEQRSMASIIQQYEQDHEIRHVCITGGEPAMHANLLNEILDAQDDWYRRHPDTIEALQFHMETSGTKSLRFLFQGRDSWNAWITCSPKEGFLPENIGFINEFKILCGPLFKIEAFEALLPDNGTSIYLQPIQGVHETDGMAFERCLAILKKKPNWALSAQLHKFIGLR